MAAPIVPLLLAPRPGGTQGWRLLFQPHRSFIPLPAGPDATAAARGSRKAAEGRPGPCGSEDTAGDSDSRDYTADSGVSRSPGESSSIPGRTGGGTQSRLRVVSADCRLSLQV